MEALYLGYIASYLVMQKTYGFFTLTTFCVFSKVIGT